VLDERVTLDDYYDIPSDPLGPRPERRITIYTAVELHQIPDPPDSDILLGPYVTRGGRTLVVGATGHGKTTLCFQMVAAIVKGQEFLGYDGSGNTTALILDLEQGMRSIKRGVREAGLYDQERVYIAPVPDGLALDAEDQRDLAEVCLLFDAIQPDVVLLDPYYKAHRAEDPNAERPIVDLMRILDALRAKHGFALILPAHPRKTQGENGVRKLSIDDISGSGAVSRGAEIGIGIERLAHGYARLRYLKDREGELPIGDAVPLIYNKSTGYQLDPKEVQSKDELESEIIRLVKDGAFHTAKEWAARLGTRQTKVRDLLESMAVSGSLQVVIGPPGRSARSRCYGADPSLFSTDPDPWEQSGTVGTVGQEVRTVPKPLPLIGEEGFVGSVHRDLPENGNSSGTVPDWQAIQRAADDFKKRTGVTASEEDIMLELRSQGYEPKPIDHDSDIPF
jgi:KaiC/GvpD/RAD55 family RecA-like ATPase